MCNCCCEDVAVVTPQIAATAVQTPPVLAAVVAQALAVIVAAVPVSVVTAVPQIGVVRIATVIGESMNTTTEPLTWNGAILFWDGDVLMIGVTYP